MQKPAVSFLSSCLKPRTSDTESESWNVLACGERYGRIAAQGDTSVSSDFSSSATIAPVSECELQCVSDVASQLEQLPTGSQANSSQMSTQPVNSQLSQPMTPVLIEEPWAILCNVRNHTSIHMMKDEFTVGRKPGSDFVCEKSTLGRRHVNCSREHFRIVKSKHADGHYLVDIEDLSSTGTFVDGILIGRMKRRPLGDMNKISIIKPELTLFIFYDLQYRTKVPGIPMEICRNYMVVNEVGQGGFGKVYSAIKLSTRETLAMKSIKLDAENIGGNLNEASIMYSVRHLNIVRVYDTHVIEDKLFIFMEFMSGGNLHHYIHNVRKSFLPEDEAKYLCMQLTQAVFALHERKIVHRDIKPLNVLLCDTRRYPHLKLSDFGLSKILNKRYETIPVTKFYGTKTFTAPELNAHILAGRALSTTYDNRTDIWSLGLLFYYIFSRQLPFKTSNDLQTSILRIQNPQFEFMPHQLWCCTSSSAKTLIRSMLRCNYRMRPYAKQVLGDPYFKNDRILLDRYCRLTVANLKTV